MKKHTLLSWGAGLTLLSGYLTFAIAGTGCVAKVYKLHVKYTIVPSSTAQKLVPCLGLLDKATGQLQQPVVCEKDVSESPSQLDHGVMDVTLTDNDPHDTWGSDKVNSGNYHLAPYLLQDGELFAADDYAFADPADSPDGDWLLTAHFTPSPDKKVEGAQTTFQSFPI